MTTTLPEQHKADASTVEEEFLAIISSDVELLRAEFDAIIAAEWPDPPPDTPAREPVDDRPQHTAQRSLTLGRDWLPRRASRPGIDGWGRERSPPPAHENNARSTKEVMCTREPTPTR